MPGRCRLSPFQWKWIMTRFWREMPVKKHRRQLRVFEDTFTGTEAVDFMMSLLPNLPGEGGRSDLTR
jgi:hypothetical protein